MSRFSTPAAAAAASARFAERVASRRRSRWLRALAGVAVAAALLGAGWVVFFSDVLVVRSVQVAGVQRLEAGQVERAAKVPLGEPLATLDTASIAARVRSLAPVGAVEVSRRFPNTVRIQVTEREPVAVLTTAQGRRLVDADGVAFAPAAAAEPGVQLPLLATTRESLPPREVVTVTEMLAALPVAIRDEVSQVDADTAADMTVQLRDGRRVVWGGPERAEFKARVLEVMLADPTTRKAKVFDVSVPEAPAVRR